MASRASRSASGTDRPEEAGPAIGTPEEILRALADPTRLSVAGQLARGPQTAAAMARATGLRTDAAQRHLSRLARVGIVTMESDRRTYRLQKEALRRAAAEAGPAREPGLALGAADGEEESVLRQYFRGGRLTEIPARRSKRLVVLERLAFEFDVGTHYPEREVNSILERFHTDVAVAPSLPGGRGIPVSRAWRVLALRRPRRRLRSQPASPGRERMTEDDARHIPDEDGQQDHDGPHKGTGSDSVEKPCQQSDEHDLGREPDAAHDQVRFADLAGTEEHPRRDRVGQAQQVRYGEKRQGSSLHLSDACPKGSPEGTEQAAQANGMMLAISTGIGADSSGEKETFARHHSPYRAAHAASAQDVRRGSPRSAPSTKSGSRRARSKVHLMAVWPLMDADVVCHRTKTTRHRAAHATSSRETGSRIEGR